MSETTNETPITDPIDAFKRKVDDLLDKVENAGDDLIEAARQVGGAKGVALLVLANAANAALDGLAGSLRTGMGVADDIGGDVD